MHIGDIAACFHNYASLIVVTLDIICVAGILRLLVTLVSATLLLGVLLCRSLGTCSLLHLRRLAMSDSLSYPQLVWRYHWVVNDYPG